MSLPWNGVLPTDWPSISTSAPVGERDDAHHVGAVVGRAGGRRRRPPCRRARLLVRGGRGLACAGLGRALAARRRRPWLSARLRLGRLAAWLRRLARGLGLGGLGLARLGSRGAALGGFAVSPAAWPRRAGFAARGAAGSAWCPRAPPRPRGRPAPRRPPRCRLRGRGLLAARGSRLDGDHRRRNAAPTSTPATMTRPVASSRLDSRRGVRRVRSHRRGRRR